MLFRRFNYSDHVRNEIKDMEVGDVKGVELGGEPIRYFRSTLSRVSKQEKKKFKTKVKDWDFFICRIW